MGQVIRSVEFVGMLNVIVYQNLPGWVVIYFDESASNIKDAYIEIV